MYLGRDGVLLPAIGRPCTHILKPAGGGGYDALPVVEWIAMELGRAAGLETPATALVPMPDGMPPALLVERFDIRRNTEDERLIAMEDLCSVLDLPSAAKYDGTMERVARAVRPLSTAPEEDLLIILKRALFAWLIADCDMHLKNLALLKIAQAGESKFQSVRMAPLYDAVTTRVFPMLRHDRLALKLNGKDDHLRRRDFLALASTAGTRISDAEAALDDVLQRMRSVIESIKGPKNIDLNDSGHKVTEEMLLLCRGRVEAFL
jgi:serine/threonine-protein kinase HipA